MPKVLRTLTLALIAASAFSLTGCGEEVLDWRNAEVSSNKVFAGNANKPFSGKVTNVPYSKILSGQRGYNTLMGQGGSIVTALHGTALLCDIAVDDGVLDGAFTCRQGQSKKPQMEGTFKSGGLSGKFTVRDARNDEVVTEAGFEDGALDGTLRRWDSVSGKKILEQMISRNVAHGAYKMWDKETGKLLLDGQFVEGKVDGEWRKFDAKGKELERSTYSGGVLNGESRKVDAKGTSLEKGTYAQGVFTGTRLKQISTDDLVIDQVTVRVVDDKVLEDAEAMARISAAQDLESCVRYRRSDFNYNSAAALEHCKAPNTAKAVERTKVVDEDRGSFPEESNQCTTAWQDAFRKENGDEALINFELAWEFVDNCRAGKRP